MIRSPNVNKQDEREDVTNDEDAGTGDAGTFDRSFKYGIIIYAVVEFFAIALLLYYKFAR
jgi:hypothetical protein